MTFQSRYYQDEAKAAIIAEWEKGNRRTLLVLPTGTGKTIVFARVIEDMVRLGKRVLILAHRGELLDQAAAKLSAATGLACSVEKAESTSIGEWFRVVVGSVQTMMREKRLEQFAHDHFDVIVVDEAHHCFPAGTLIDGIPIEELQAGDAVFSFNHTQNVIEKQPVSAVMSKSTDSIVRIVLSNGNSIVCTPDHPIWNGTKYIDAIRLSRYNMVYERRAYAYQAESVFSVRDGFSTTIMEQQDDSILFGFVQKRSEGLATKGGFGNLPALWEGLSRIWKTAIPGIERKNLLLQRMQFCGESRSERFDYGGDESEVCFRQNETQQPHEERGASFEDVSFLERETFLKSHGEWSIYQTSASTFRRIVLHVRQWICARIRNINSRCSGKNLKNTELLQGGHSPRGIENCNRSGWEVAQSTRKETRRHTKNTGLDAVRVESVEVFKRGSGSEFERLCPNGLVYNIEVAGNNNYFANEVLVHNCLAESYQRALDWFPDAFVLGVTATPDRGDMRELGQFFQSLAYEYTLPRAIKDRYLSPIKALTIPLKIELGGAAIQAGDFKAADVGNALDPYLYQIAEEMKAHCQGRKTVVFLPLIATSQKFCSILNSVGFRAVEVNGQSDNRDSVQADFERGRYDVICNAMLYTEGWDCPIVDCIVPLRATKIRSLYCLDKQTEVLTVNGWKSNVEAGDLVAAFDPASQEVRYVPALATVRRLLATNEYFISLKSQSSDIRVTNKHRMLYDHKRLTGWKWKTAEELAALRDTSYIPVAGIKNSEGVPLTDDELRFIGWVMTDGSINYGNGQITITQGQHQPWGENIQKCIEGCGFKHNKFTRVRTGITFNKTSDADVWTISRGAPRGRDKHLRGWESLDRWLSKDFALALMDVTPAQFAVLLESIHEGDGAKQNNQSWTRRSYHIGTGNKTFADRLQICAVLNGYRANVSVEHGQNRLNPFYLVHIKKQIWSRIGGQYSDRPNWVSEPHTEEECWCVENEVGTLVTRRNGKVTIVGNCQMVGRGTRIFPDKENLLILDFLWHSERHELCRPAHLIAESKEVADKMTQLIAEAGCPADLEQMEIATENSCVKDREERLAEKLREMRHRKRKLVDPLQFEMSIQAEDLSGYVPAFGWEAAPPSKTQVAALEKAGIFPDEIDNAGKASLLLERLAKRRTEGLATPKQIRFLESKGYQHVGTWDFECARKMIDRIAGNGWMVPRDINPATYVPKQKQVQHELEEAGELAF